MSKTTKRKQAVDTKPALKKRKLHHAGRLGPIVRGDALKWKEAQLPDRMEDAEGFYGLEEIDNVEILKDENGQISFRPKTAEDVIIGDGEVAGEEWTGFDHDESARNETDGFELQSQSIIESKVTSSKSDQPKQQKSKKAINIKEKKVEKASSSKSKASIAEATEVEDEIDFTALDEAQEDVQADVTAWKELGLSPSVLSAISVLGFSEPTPIQKAAIPPIRDGRDFIGKAVTGSGKTLAFGVPIIEKWLESSHGLTKAGARIPTAFILAPTRELAHQLSKHLLALSRGLEQSPRIATVTGGLALVKQQRQLEYSDIIIGTPGRLWEVINSSHGLIDRLKQIQFLVIDEADRLLSEGHFKEVEEILDVLNRKETNETGEDQDEDDEKSTNDPAQPIQRQTLVFSATFHKGLQQKLASKQKWRPGDSDLLSNTQSLDYLIRKLRFQHGVKPTFVDANPTSSMAENLSETILECGAMQKDLYLYSLLLWHQHQQTKHLRSNSTLSQDDKISRTLIFTNSISTVKRLVPLLTTLSIPKTSVLPLHSSMPQKSRLRSLERLTKPVNQSDTMAILIATDVAARGLDIKGVHTIIHYHVPRTADMYVHRSGRTARASSSGRSILICSPDEVAGVTRLISKIHLDKSQSKSKPSKAHIQPLYLPASLPSQVDALVTLAQKITSTTLSTSQSKSEDSWLRNAASELGVDYSSDDFDATSRRGRRGRGGAHEDRKKDAVQQSARGDVRIWKAELKAELESMMRRGVDFGDGEGAVGRRGKFLAGGAVDVEKLLRESINA